MDITDSGEFRNRLVVLGELFDAKLSPAKLALYFEALRDVPFMQVARALNQAAKTCTFFPKPAELRRFALGDDEDAAEAAWMAFRAAMRSAGGYASLVADAALGEAISAVFGGWPQACSLELTPEMWSSKRKEFGRVYRVLRDRALVGSRYLAGICEQQNAGRRDWLKFVPVMRLSSDGQIEPLGLEAAEQCRGELAAASHGFSRLLSANVEIAVSRETA